MAGFSYALKRLKEGSRVKRHSWGKGYFLQLHKEYGGGLIMKMTPDYYDTWVPDQQDILAKDWDLHID